MGQASSTEEARGAMDPSIIKASTEMSSTENKDSFVANCGIIKAQVQKLNEEIEDLLVSRHGEEEACGDAQSLLSQLQEQLRLWQEELDVLTFADNKDPVYVQWRDGEWDEFDANMANFSQVEEQIDLFILSCLPEEEEENSNMFSDMSTSSVFSDISVSPFEPGAMSGTLRVHSNRSAIKLGGILLSGTIIQLHVEEEIGYLRSEDGSEILFTFSPLVNTCNRDIILGPGSNVLYVADSDMVAVLVEVDEESDGRKVVVFPCGHSTVKEHHEREEEMYCQDRCGVEMSCGNRRCREICGIKHVHTDCDICNSFTATDVTEEEEVPENGVRQMTIDEIMPRTFERVEEQQFILEDLVKDGDTQAEYQEVEDQVMKFIDPIHGWMPQISKIEKVTNVKLEETFEQARREAFKDYWVYKFHGTSQAAIDSIIRDGFRMPTRAGMYGAGLYFATNSSKSAQTIYTKGSERLLLCKVLLGKSKKLIRHDHGITASSLRSEGFDSVYAPRNTKSTGGVVFDEYVVYRPEYTLPSYIIHYSSNQ